MKELGHATEHEVVLAFLQAEIDSPRFGQVYSKILNTSNLRRSDLIDTADLNSERDNQLRIKLLQAVRGYRANRYLFQGFPASVQWRRVSIEPNDHRSLKYANFPTWVDLSGGTRLALDGAKNIDAIQTAENANTNIKAVADMVRSGRRYPELIAAEGDVGTFILIEGHTRATAYIIAAIPDPITAFLGSSPSMRQWAFY